MSRLELPELAWPERLLGPVPTVSEWRVAATVVVAVALILALGQPLIWAKLGTSLFGEKGGDFAEFYFAGKLLNEYGGERLYDFEVQKKLYLEIRPEQTSLTLPFVYAPPVALLCRPLALLPFWAAYLVWVAIMFGLYAAGVQVVLSRFGPEDRHQRGLLMLLALSFEPFSMECLSGGQISVLWFLAMAGAVLLEDSGRPVVAGLALSLLFCKPSHLVLILPMLLLTKRVRVLAGFAVGVVGWIAVSLATVGEAATLDYFRNLSVWGKLTTGTRGLFKTSKYVDLNAFTQLFPGGRSGIGMTVAALFAAWVLWKLARAWWASDGTSPAVRKLVWASAITWTMVLNIYAGLYDCVVLSLACLLVVSVAQSAVPERVPNALRLLLVAVYLTPWFTQWFADWAGVQVYTLVLAAFGFWQLSFLARLKQPATESCP